MTNVTSIRIPKKYAERVKEVFHDEDGYWLYLNRGWHNSDDYALHIIHEDTQAEVLKKLRWTEPCDCDWCTGKER